MNYPEVSKLDKLVKDGNIYVKGMKKWQRRSLGPVNLQVKEKRSYLLIQPANPAN